MDENKLLNEAHIIEQKCHQLKQFQNNLTQQLDSLGKEIISMNNQLDKLNTEINTMQKKKIKLDKIKCKLEIDVEDIADKMKQYNFLKTHLEALKQRKHLLEKYTLEKGLELEENTLKDKLDNVWDYFNNKHFKLDEEINTLERTLTNRQNLASKIYEKECDKYKTSIEKLKEENFILEKKLNLISKLDSV